MAEKDKIKDFLVDWQKMLREAVAKAKDLIGIDEHTGDVVFKISLTTLSV